jgi:GNAT superfamily N-acetyltransferase
MTNPNPVLVRPVAASDRERWETLFVAYGVFYTEDFPPDVVDGVWRWLMAEDHPVRCFVAEIEGVVVGFAHLRFQHDTFTAGAGWFLDDLFTDPDARGRGAATALISALDDYATAHGGGTLRWITAADNDRARRLYDTLATPATWVTYEREVGQ